MKTDKDSIIRFFKRLTTNLNQTITDMKSDFQNQPVESSEIKHKLISWKSKYSELVAKSLKQNIFAAEGEPQGFQFKIFMSKVIADFGQDVQFMDQAKSLNLSIERLKQFIRESLVKDPSMFELN